MRAIVASEKRRWANKAGGFRAIPQVRMGNRQRLRASDTTRSKHSGVLPCNRSTEVRVSPENRGGRL